jgi:hypothetical protein
MPKLCEFETCRNRATYGVNKNPIRCLTHKDKDMKLSSSFCYCGKNSPNYNLCGMPAKFCSKCKTDDMIDVKHKKCECGKSQPTYNYIGLVARFCFLCKTSDMIDVKHNLCECGKSRPLYNLLGLNAKYCLDCKTNEMVNVSEKRVCKCGKSRPNYNYKGLVPEYCSKCKNHNMVDINHKKCECGNSQPIYNYIGLVAKYCSLCKANDMVDVKHNLCKCGIARPTFNYANLKPEYCASCKKDGMINVKDDRCKAENCLTRGNKNYKGYCANCFQHLFPTDPLTFQIRSKTKEIAVRDFINSRFEGFQHDKPLWYNETACDCTTKRRIDHRKLINDTLLCIETDENQHKSYSKEDEIARYNDLFMAFGGKFIFIRFNPDKYKDKNGKSSNPMLVNRLLVLESEINKQIKRIETNENIELLEVIELFYDKSIYTF